MTTSFNDQHLRKKALNTQRSFIVQAPAGSGKTELLVQRYLALLSESTTPEAVLALTFTRKAALEMKQRVLETLQLASDSTLPASASYEHTRQKLGQKLHQWQKERQWDLLTYPERLQIQTLDAFYAQLVRKTPISSGFNNTTTVLEDPIILYETAIFELLTEQEKDSQLSRALTRLARHLNNDTLQIKRLLVHMLAHRDQWMGLIPQNAYSIQKLKISLEESLQSLCKTAYQEAEHVFSQLEVSDWRQALESLVGAIYYPIQTTSSLSDDDFWPALCRLMLTKQGTWRKTAPHQGIKEHPEAVQKLLKSSLKKWISILNTHTQALSKLDAIAKLPPVFYTEPQWELLSDLFHILNALLAILEDLFQKHNQLDYIAIALKAEQLLGEAENPSQLLLNLDYQIQHILIDELQDTSLQQLRFLNRLTEGWQPLDGRTLFLVGDPMQSIYRFRKAEARLFNLIKRNGLGNCELESLTLSTNFRATKGLIHWINRHFKAISTLVRKKYSQENLFQTSNAFSSNTQDTTYDAVHTHWLTDASTTQEAEAIVSCVASILKNTTDRQPPSIAILGRSRQHLLPIVTRLHTEGIRHQAIEIEPLAEKPVIRDLLTLTRALTHLGDDIAWLAVLRAPWCGLYLSDLHHLMEACRKTQPTRLIWEQLQHLDSLVLSEDAKKRLTRFTNVIDPIVKSYGRMPLKDRIIKAWHLLDGPFIQPTHSWHPEDVERFLDCIDEMQVGETLIDSDALEAKLKTIYASNNQKRASQVVVMTIHKAKGLEFDAVILPYLHKTTRSQSHPLILFDEMPSLDKPHLLLAPIKASDTTEPDPIYRYLRQLDTQQHQAEVTRLFYVACTRAKKELHLFANLQLNEEKEILPPPTDTFLSWLWPTLDDSQKQLIEKYDTESSDTSMDSRKLKRIVLNKKTIPAPDETV